MSKFLRLMTLWLWGGFVFYCIELLWRGYSYPSMFVVGGACFLIIGGINNYLPWSVGLVWQALIGGVAVTAVEFVSGIFLNIWLGLGIWDYSHLPFNLLGQICLLYSLIWVALSVVGIFLDDYLRWKLYGEQRPKYVLI
ncbi:MAG: putative ABC transporter permease [Oscillospiraceae bacterium]|nr:putative ABC transporter permease [Oscillospiraceae bacterium]